MKVSYNWLQEYVSEKLPEASKVAEALTMHSFEIEGVEEKDEDKIIDIKVLPNRSHDCLSHYGIAREISSVLGLKLKPADEALIQPLATLDNFKIVVEDKHFCGRISAVLIKDIEVGDSPDWLIKRLEVMGQRSINNVVDITNYVMFAFGQPMHAFDFDAISGDAIYVRSAAKGEKITLLNDKEHVLDESIFVIADQEKALDVAGIIGGKNTSTYRETKNILLVVDNFDPVSIRKSSKKLGIRTESSARFENHISPSLVSLGVTQAVLLLNKIVERKTVVGWVEHYPAPYKSPEIKISPEKVSSILGKAISAPEIQELLRKQNIKVVEADSGLIVTPPDFRLDLVIEEDIAEEVGRLYGYNNISPVSLNLESPKEVNQEVLVSQLIRNVLTKHGFSEIYSYAFAGSGEVEVENPLAGDKKFLRSNLAGSMENSLEQNFKHLDLLGITEVKTFEIGKVFREKGETLNLCLGVKYPKSKKSIPADEEVAKAIRLVEDAARVSLGDVSIVGGIAEFDLTRILQEMNPRESYPSELWNIEEKNTIYKSISVFPFAVRDVAVFVPNEVSVEKVEELIKAHITNIVVRFSLFDKFVKGDKTSYAFRLVFQSNDKTLTEDEITSVMNPIYDTLKSQSGFEIR